MSGKYENLQKVNELEKEALIYDIEGWLQYDLFTFDWWVLLAIAIIPWVIFVMLVDRKRIIEILLFGMFTIQITALLDILGTELDFWLYPTSFIPIFPRAFPFDISMIPVTLMLLYQFFKTWKSYSISLIIMAIVFAFIGEPFCVAQELVIYKNWNYFYSFLVYLTIGTGVKALVEKLK